MNQIWLRRVEAGAKNVGLKGCDGETHYALPIKNKQGQIRTGRCQNCNNPEAVVFQSVFNKDMYFLLCSVCGKYVSAMAVGARKCKCGETLPAGRKKFCYKCRRPSEKQPPGVIVELLEVQYNPGRVVLTINGGKPYAYHVDAGGIETFLKLLDDNKNGKAVAFLKSIKLR